MGDGFALFVPNEGTGLTAHVAGWSFGLCKGVGSLQGQEVKVVRAVVGVLESQLLSLFHGKVAVRDDVEGLAGDAAAATELDTWWLEVRLDVEVYQAPVFQKCM